MLNDYDKFNEPILELFKRILAEHSITEITKTVNSIGGINGRVKNKQFIYIPADSAKIENAKICYRLSTDKTLFSFDMPFLLKIRGRTRKNRKIIYPHNLLPEDKKEYQKRIIRKLEELDAKLNEYYIVR